MGNPLDRALSKAKKISLDVSMDRYAIMSDQHIGDGIRGSDDFRENRDIYKRALEYYFTKGYRIITLGDNEELWECDFQNIHGKYPDIYALEKKLLDENRLLRLYGNHDIFWRQQSFLDSFLTPVLPGVAIHESILLENTAGRIFLTHGHQGELFSDAMWPVSRFFVRYIWKPLQYFFGFKNTGAAKNIKKRNEKEQSFYRWAKNNRLLFIAGHTHRAIFGSLSKIDRLRMEEERLTEGLSSIPADAPEYELLREKLDNKKMELQESLKKEFGTIPEPKFEEGALPLPCYFNDGCCCYIDGITTMEIDREMIRLVKWDRANNARVIRQEDRLLEIFSQIAYQ